ncbi:MAG: hypothetical protein ABI587_13955 [Gemmatimonadales bacterium]
MSRRSLVAACAAATLTLAACSSPEPSDEPTAPVSSNLTQTLSVSPETQALEPVARRLALALGEPAFRQRLHDELERSPFREHKLQLQRHLASGGGQELRALAQLNGESAATTDSIVRRAQLLEIYLPVRAHRTAWKGDNRLLVATQAKDHELIVAYDLQGGRHYLDPTRPPDTPVLAVVPVETDFDHAGGVSGDQTCPPPDCGSGGGGSPPPSIVTPGLYMTKAHMTGDFEGWLKGNPEFEIHIMGQLGTTDSLVRYACAGEHQPSPYDWNGDTDWSGSVMLFSAAQITSYKTAHPGQSFRVVAMEDDDTSCDMRIDPNRWATFLGTIGPLYQDVTGTIDSGGVKRYVSAGRSLLKLLSKLASWLKSNDDLIGNAVEDKVTGEFHTGYNWNLKADGNNTNGWIYLVMK